MGQFMHHGYPDPAECSQARARLNDFEESVREESVRKARLDAELKAAFTPPAPILIPQRRHLS